MGRCEWCAKELDAPAKTGRPRRYCSGRCREAARRDRTAVKRIKPFEGFKTKIETPPLPSMSQRRAAVFAHVATLVEGAAPAPIETRLARVIFELAEALKVFEEAADKMPPGIRWRCENSAAALHVLLDEHWQGVLRGGQARPESE